MNDTPGRMLSSFTGGDKQQPKLGGCVGVFFQLFDWNRRLTGKRLFSHKLLPAERPKPVSKKFADEKMPMAKLLLIADENRGGFPYTKRSLFNESDPSSRDRNPGDDSKKRTPGVVARLMGLESMPAPECHSEGGRGVSQQKKALEAPPLEGLLQKGDGSDPEGTDEKEPQKLKKRSLKKKLNRFARRPAEEPIRQLSTKRSVKKPPSKSQSDALHHLVVSKSAKAPGTLTRHVSIAPVDRGDEARAIFFSKLPPLSPHHIESPLWSMLSPSKSYNKLAPPTKSPLTARSTVHLFEAAAKILEPNMQPNNRPRNPSLPPPVARPLLREIDAEGKAGEKPSQMFGASKKASSNLMRMKGQPLSKSWNGPNAEHGSSRTASSNQVGGKRQAEQPVSSLSNSAISSDQLGSRRQAGMLHQKPNLTSEHPKMGELSRRQEKQPSIPGDSRLKDQDLSASSRVENTRGQKSLAAKANPGQGTLHRSGSAKEDVHPISSVQQLLRSRSVKEDRHVARLAPTKQDLKHRVKAAKEDKGKPEFHNRVPALHTNQDSVAVTDLRHEVSLNQKSQGAGNTIGIKTTNVKKAGFKQFRDTSPPRGSKVVHLDNAVAVPQRNPHEEGFAQSTGALSSVASLESVHCTSVPSDTCSSRSSGIFSYSKLFGSRYRKDAKAGRKDEKEESIKIETTQKRELSSLMTSLFRSTRTNEDGVLSEQISSRDFKPIRSSLPCTETKEIRAYYSDFSDSMECDRDSRMSYQNSVLGDMTSQGYRGVAEFSSCTVGHGSQVSESQEYDSYKRPSMLQGSSAHHSRERSFSDAMPETSIDTSEFWSHKNSVPRRGLSNDSERSIPEVTSRSSKVAPADYSSQSSCGSSSGDIRDTSSSKVYPELARRRKESFSLTGKTTAAILQELLMTLNASRSNFPEKELSVNGDSLLDPDRFSGSEESGASTIEDQRVSCGKGQVFTELLATADSGNFVQDNQEVSSTVQDKPSATAETFVEECYYMSDSVCTDACGQPSPISILESPFHDEANSSDSFESIRETRDEAVDVASGSGRDQTDVFLRSEVDESRIHHFDPPSIGLAKHRQSSVRDEKQYVREIMCAANLMSENLPLLQLVNQNTPIEQVIFDKLEKQVTEWGWGLLSASCHSSDQNSGDGCSADLDTSFRESQQETCRRNRKLIFDCVNEALSSKLRIYCDSTQWVLSSMLSCPSPSGSRLVSCVHEQIEDWREMAGGTMLDDLVEKDMRSSCGRWSNFESEVSEIGIEIESDIMGVLIEELVGDLSSCWMVPSRSASIKTAICSGRRPRVYGSIRSVLR